MKFSVCIVSFKDVDYNQDQWNSVLKSYRPEKIYVLGSTPWNFPIHKDNVEQIWSLDDLPDKKIVMMTPQSGRYVPGEVSLEDFEHTDDSIYVFGPDWKYLTPDFIGEKKIDHKVYIPADTELYSWVAGAITFYDLGAKNASSSSNV